MNSELINRIPSVIVEIIICWTIEFHRADAYERFSTFRASYDACMKQICEDIRMNTPIYRFTILTQSGQQLYLNLFLPNCDPYKVRPHQVPESRIHGFQRRSTVQCL
jgi:hypothetical protein